MIKAFLDRWNRKGNTRRIGEMAVMGLVVAATVLVAQWLGYDDTKTEAVVGLVLAYVTKLVLPTEK